MQRTQLRSEQSMGAAMTPEAAPRTDAEIARIATRYASWIAPDKGRKFWRTTLSPKQFVEALAAAREVALLEAEAAAGTALDEALQWLAISADVLDRLTDFQPTVGVKVQFRLAIHDAYEASRRARKIVARLAGQSASEGNRRGEDSNATDNVSESDGKVAP